MRSQFFVVLFFALSFQSVCSAKLLDKTLTVINNEVITSSQIDRVLTNLKARQNISPIIFYSDKLSQREIVDIFIQKKIIRDKLTEQGFIVSDDQVESHIKDTEQRLRLDRKALLSFLESNNMTFDEYFELIRESIEYNIFHSKIIVPLISITEQEIKNTFYREYTGKKSLAFKYVLVDLSIQKNKVTKEMLKNMQTVFTNFQNGGSLPDNFSSVESTTLGDITESGLSQDLRDLLKDTDEGSMSRPILIDDNYHVFFIKKKDLVESDLFLAEKDRIRDQIFERNSRIVSEQWFGRERTKHYIKYFF